MDKLNHHEIIHLLLQLAIMLVAGRGMAELSRKINQPSVVGEILAGLVLGPSVFGAISPELFSTLFPQEQASAVVLDGFVQVAVVLLLFIAGLEVDLSIVFNQGRKAVLTSFFALVIPFAFGAVWTYLFPNFFGIESETHRLVFSLFFGTIMCITALPVIARILLDLQIFKTNLGMLIISSAMIIDIIGWLIFSAILGMMDAETSRISLKETIMLTVGFTLIMLSFGRGVFNRALPWVNRTLSWPGGVLSISLAICFLAAAFTEYIGIHAIFGAFIIGIALGDSEYFSERAKEIIHQFVNNIFAPLFFVSIGLYVNFIENFDPILMLVVIVIATIGKVSGGAIGARLGGMSKMESLAIGFGMNTHGTLEVILGTIALSSGLINERVFVAIIAMVIVTVVVSSPLMRYFLGKPKK